MRSIPFLFLACLFLVSCSNQHTVDESDSVVLGQLEHGFTVNPTVQEKFDEGLLLLHNFEYDDALTAFEEATALDNTEVLTHWGEAMCHYKALWKLQNTEDGKAVIARFGATRQDRLASIEDPLEQDLWALVELMYGDGDFDTRNMLIKEHLSALNKKYPTNQEIAAFYALSLIWTTENYGDGSDDLSKAAAIADEIIAVNPLHPGALHYKIHALDGPVSAADAVDAADAYAKVAPDAAHALHMPSHIYLALGNWTGVVHSNERSYDASVARMENLGLSDGARGYHSLAWWHYGLLQQGRYEEAAQLLSEMLTYAPKEPTKGARGYLLGMQNSQLVETGDAGANNELDLDVDVTDLSISSKAERSFIRAQLAFQNQDVETLEEEIKWLTSKIYLDSLNIGDSGVAMCASGNSRYAPTENAVRMAQVMVNQIEAYKALLNKDEALFESKMQQAVDLEDRTNYPTGPPSIAKPSFEQYGEWLLAQERYQEAKDQFDRSLARMPRRAKSLEGKYAALKALGQMEESELVQEELQNLYAHNNTEALGD